MLALLGFLGLAAMVPMCRFALVRGGVGPGWLSAIWLAEAVLCPLTGLAAWLVWQRIDVGLDRKRVALRGWGWLMLLSALWPAAMDGLGQPAVALVLLLIGLAAGLWTARAFRRSQPAAPFFLWPFLGWLALMAGITIVNF